MDKANIIISIIIVLCIAAAVAAYGITNSNNPIFSDLSSMDANDDTDDGLGNNTTDENNGTNVSASPSSSSSGIASGGSGSVNSGGSSSGSSSSSGSNSGSSYNSGSSSSSKATTTLSYSEAKSIANSAVGEPGCYAGDGYYSGGFWYFTIYDENGNNVDTISVNDATGATGRG